MAMRDRERGTVFWSFGYPENIDQTHQMDVSILVFWKRIKIEYFIRSPHPLPCANTLLR